jgi:hypothetical protein
MNWHGILLLRATTRLLIQMGAIEHLLIDGFVFSYWVDHAVQLVMITEIDDAE